LHKAAAEETGARKAAKRSGEAGVQQERAMREVLFAAAFAVVAAAGFVALPATAFASETDDVARCAAALDANGVAAADAYRPKFVKSRGAQVRKIELLLVPNNGGESIAAVCEIKKGEVISAAVKA